MAAAAAVSLTESAECVAYLRRNNTGWICMRALDKFRKQGNLREARTILLDALARSNVHLPNIFHAWICIEKQAGSDASGIRKLFKAWGCCYGDGGGKNKGGGGQDGEEGEAPPTPSKDEVGFWCRYISFELQHGTAASVRNVGERAVAACPRVRAVHADYANAELRLGCPDRDRALA